MVRKYVPFAKVEPEFIFSHEFETLSSDAQLFYLKLWTYAVGQRTDTFLLDYKNFRTFCRKFQKTSTKVLKLFSEISENFFENPIIEYKKDEYVKLLGVRVKHSKINFKDHKGGAQTCQEHEHDCGQQSESESESELNNPISEDIGNTESGSVESQKTASGFLWGIGEIRQACLEAGVKNSADLDRLVNKAYDKLDTTSVDPYLEFTAKIFDMLECKRLGKVDEPVGAAVSAIRKNQAPARSTVKNLSEIVKAHVALQLNVVQRKMCREG